MTAGMLVERYTETEWCSYTHAATAHAQLQQTPLPGKPMGTWISVPGDDDWPSWCRANEWKLEALAYRHTLRLNMRHVLLIDTLAKLEAFDAELEPRPDLPSLPGRGSVVWPHWGALVKRYAGIVIAPYQWALRCDLIWYYGWDCASGCIWDPRVLTHVKSERVKP